MNGKNLGSINIEFLEKYAGAYDVSRSYNLTRISDYSAVLYGEKINLI